jgi:hypothetical protein
MDEDLSCRPLPRRVRAFEVILAPALDQLMNAARRFRERVEGSRDPRSLAYGFAMGMARSSQQRRGSQDQAAQERSLKEKEEGRREKSTRRC